MRKPRLLLSVALSLATLGLVASFAAAKLTCAGLAPVTGNHFNKLILVILENTNYEDAIRQPFQASLISQGTLLSNFSGIAHPSQPNYIALVSGATHGVIDDGSVDLNAQHLGDQIGRAHV